MVFTYPSDSQGGDNHRGLYTWTSPDGQYRNQIDYILPSQR